MRLRAPILSTTLVVLLTACGGTTSADPGSSASPGGDVVLVTHDSWAMPKKVIAAWEAKTGYHLTVRASGDAGELTNKLVLTAGDPDGDVSFGVDNTFLGRAQAAHVFAGDQATPIDHSAVCVNVDLDWFAAHHLNPPSNLADLTTPAYKSLMVTEGASTSSPGMAFLLATIAAFSTKTDPDGWQDYWQALLANGLKVDDSWEQAYNGDYTLGGGKYPIVVSYDSDPAYTVKGGRTQSRALLNTCFAQVEYAGVLAGAKNPAGAQSFLDFLTSQEAQAALPTSMYVFPVVKGIALPASWKRYAVQPAHPWSVGAATINANRDTWLQQWTDLVQK